MKTEIEPTNKRLRTEGDENWQISRRTKRKSIDQESTTRTEECEPQVNIYGKEKLPKQFTLAKLLQQNKVTNIIRVKYINLYKISITFNDEPSA